MKNRLTIIGGGLAGSEAAWQAAQRGIAVTLHEMRPDKMTPAHKTGRLAELVCSNSFKSAALDNASGLLKEELRRQGSLIMDCADRTLLPAGGALAVDRDLFAQMVTEKLQGHPLIEIIHQEVSEFPPGPAIIATGPLTSPALTKCMQQLLTGFLYFYDAAAPVVTRESLANSQVFRASRYDKGEAAYLNCPLNKEQYDLFYQQLLTAERYPLAEFEREVHFEGCMPVEVLAARGYDTLRFGPLKPVGLTDPATGKQPYAVVQLRQDDAAGTLYNIVGFQTNLRWSEQRRVFGLIPGLQNAEYMRYGLMHRNIFINAPQLLMPTWQLKAYPQLFVAGQLSGVEGYLESTASGLQAGINAARLLQDKELLSWPEETICGALANYITKTSGSHFQPMNANFGIVPPLERRCRKKQERNQALAKRSLAVLKEFGEKNQSEKIFSQS